MLRGLWFFASVVGLAAVYSADAHAFYLQTVCETTVIKDSDGNEIPGSEITKCYSYIIPSTGGFSGGSGGGGAPAPGDDGGPGGPVGDEERDGQDRCPVEAVDISIEAGVMGIDAEVMFTGDGATPENIATITNSIETGWTQTHGPMATDVGLNVVTVRSSVSDTIIINVSPLQRRGEYDPVSNTIFLGNPRYPGIDADDIVYEDFVASHEFGHAVGLGDRYIGAGTPMANSAGTLMGDPNSDGSLTAGEAARLAQNIDACNE